MQTDDEMKEIFGKIRISIAPGGRLKRKPKENELGIVLGASSAKPNRAKNRHQNESYNKDPNQKVQRRCRTVFGGPFKAIASYKSSIKIPMIGCTWGAFCDHIESQFDGNMTWDNYAEVWEIDHIERVDRFDHTNDDERKACWHYTNLRPKHFRANAREGRLGRHRKRDKLPDSDAADQLPGIGS